MAHCFACKQSIHGERVRAVNKDWHPECFRCHGCMAPIGAARFSLYKGRAYHPQCFLCHGCGQPISERQFLTKDDAPYHERCYHARFSKTCDACGTVLEGKYIRDHWGNAYCARHLKKMPTCFSCGRLICEAITRGGVKYSDGVTVCNICFQDALRDQGSAERVFEQTRAAFEAMGFGFQGKVVPFRLVGADELTKLRKRKKRPAVGMARSRLMTLGREVVRREFVEIVIQQGLPREHFETVAVHELCHAWLFLAGAPKLPEKLEEGLCTVAEYLWLQPKTTPEAEFRKKLIRESPDPIYGEGFRMVWKAAQKHSLAKVVSHVRDKGKLPGWSLF